MINRLYKKGWTVYQIAEYLHLSPNEVRVELGIYVHAGARSKEDEPLNVPSCVTPDVFIAWRESQKQSRKAAQFCRDCTPEFQQKNIAAGRCDRPDVKFHFVALPDEGIEEVQGIEPGGWGSGTPKVEGRVVNGWRIPHN